jgi:transposase
VSASPPQTLEEALAENALLRTQVRTLLLRIEELERRLNQTSQNSSRPPSSNPPSVKLPPKRKPSGRKPGGQRGHDGHHRELVAADKVDAVVDHWPSACENCRHDLPPGIRVEVGDPLRHQVAELPEVLGRVTEYRLHTQECPGCQWATECPWPKDVPTGAFGPRLTGVVAVLTGCYRMSTRMAEEVIRDVFGVQMSLGTVVRCEQTASEIVAPAVEEARAYAQQQAVAHADETSWRERRQKAWLWIMATTFVIVFYIHRRRNRVAARGLLGTFQGTLVSDRWAPYLVHDGRRQICWSHLDRDFHAMSEYKGKSGRIGKELVRLTRKMFRWWHCVRDGTMTRARFQRKMRSLQQEVEDLLKQGVERAAPRVSGMCWDIIGNHGDALWTFVEIQGVEPTNNRAERPLRHAVMWRKSSYGSHSEEGSRFVERMLTIRATLRAQGRNVVHYVTQAIEASLRGLPPPSLLPSAAA